MSRISEIMKKREPLYAGTNDNSFNMEEYYNSILSESDIKKSVSVYRKEMQDIENQFEKLTKLSRTDNMFLLLATGLQCLRQYFLTPFHPTVSEDATKSDDKKFFREQTNKLTPSQDKASKQGGYYFAKFEQICADPKVPYDTVTGGSKFGLKMGGTTHRYKTLGHDPILGYFFGTANILTNTLTTTKGDSFHIRQHSIYSHANTVQVIESSYERLKNDPTAFAAALIKQAIHIRSDMNTPNRIPFPAISIISSDLSKTLAEYGLNYSDTLTVGKQAMFSALINFIIATLHGFMMSKNNNLSDDMKMVKTKKILLCSNMLSTSSNLIYTHLTKKYDKLDVGGFAVTLYRLFSDINFITQIQLEFLNSELSEIYRNKSADIEMYYK